MANAFNLLPAFCFLTQAIEVAVERADVNITVHDGRRGIHIVPNFQFRKETTILSGQNVEPSGFVAKHQSAIHYWRGAPNRCASQTLPDDFTLISCQAISVSIVRTDIDAILHYDRAD